MRGEQNERYSKNFNDGCRCRLYTYRYHLDRYALRRCLLHGLEVTSNELQVQISTMPMNTSVELNEYLKHNFNYEELAGWYTMQVLKYLVRAGKKEGEKLR